MHPSAWQESHDVVHAMPQVLVYLCMMAVLMGLTLHVQHLSCREGYATCIVKAQGMMLFGTPSYSIFAEASLSNQPG